MQILQDHGITAQTSPYPLALSDIHGRMRPAKKIAFVSVMQKHFPAAFPQHCPLLDHPMDSQSVIIDLLYYIHMPPGFHVDTFEDYASEIWDRTVATYAINHRCQHIYIVIDKPDFLPAPRVLVHQTRSQKAGPTSELEPKISDTAHIPHGCKYSSLLSLQSFKSKLIMYLTNKFTDKAVTATHVYPLQVILDTPSSSTILHINGGVVTHHTPNKHGEADYAMWHHAIHTPSSHVLVISSDTDSWVYGVGIMELGWLQDKTVYVKRGNISTSEFVDINNLCSTITAHSQLQKLAHPASSIVALYVLTGCDYVSSFYRCTKAAFLDVLLQNFDFVFENSLVTVEDDKVTGINQDAWMLVTAVYYYKHKVFFRRKPIQIAYNNIVNFPDSAESQRIFSTIGYPPTHRITSLVQWHDLIRKTNYHISKVTRFHEAKMIPSWNALLQHQQRATYVLLLVYSSPRLECHVLEKYTSYGWQLISSSIELVWDAPLSISTEQPPVSATDSDSESDNGGDGSDSDDKGSDASDEDLHNREQPHEQTPEVNGYGSDSDYEL